MYPFRHRDGRYCETGNKENPCGEKDRELTKKHKEESEARRKLDEDDREKISAALDKCTYPLTEHHTGVYYIRNGLVAPDTVNVQDALTIGREQ